VYTIGQFSRICQLSIKTLRFYDEIGLFKPHWVDPSSGYRYYTAEQLPRAYEIIVYRDLGFSLEQIKQLVNTKKYRDSRKLMALLLKRKREIRQQIESQREQFYKVQRHIKRLKEGIKLSTGNVILKEVDSIKVMSVRGIGPYSIIGALIGELGKFAGENHIRIAGPPICVCHDKEYKETDADLEVCFPVATDFESTERIECEELPAHEMATLIHKGPYDTLGESYGKILAWINENGYQIIDWSREVYLSDPEQVSPEEYITEIQFPVRKTS